MTFLEHRAVLIAFATLVFFTALAGDAWRNSISWYGFGAVALIVTAVSATLLIRSRRRVTAASIPWPLIAFLVLATASIAWSFYPGASALGVAVQIITTLSAVAVALVVDRLDALRALSFALRAILVLSLAFEFVVEIVVRQPVLPVWVSAPDRVDPPLMLLWSRELLFDGGPIQGVIGNSGLLGMIALLSLIVFGVQLAAGLVRRPAGIAWLTLALVVFALTRPTTIIAAAFAVVVVVVMLMVIRRANTRRARAVSYGVFALGVAAIATAVVAFRAPLLELFGKSPDLTGRFDIWDAVIGLAVQRPVFGWGWVSFWPPWVEPFDDLVTRNGVTQLHAHNAWLDVWLQLGLLGIVVFASLVVVTAVRSWMHAARSPRRVAGTSSGPAVAALPLLLLTALFVQSLAESRLLVEGGWVLLVIVAIWAKESAAARGAERVTDHGASPASSARSSVSPPSVAG